MNLENHMDSLVEELTQEDKDNNDEEEFGEE
jgi:hypothetical protein